MKCSLFDDMLNDLSKYYSTSAKIISDKIIFDRIISDKHHCSAFIGKIMELNQAPKLIDSVVCCHGVVTKTPTSDGKI